MRPEMAPSVPSQPTGTVASFTMSAANTADKQHGNVEQPTAFIMKLFEMIHAAPDEVIAVSSLQIVVPGASDTSILNQISVALGGASL
jgi:hypothetical protein